MGIAGFRIVLYFRSVYKTEKWIVSEKRKGIRASRYWLHSSYWSKTIWWTCIRTFRPKAWTSSMRIHFPKQRTAVRSNITSIRLGSLLIGLKSIASFHLSYSSALHSALFYPAGSIFLLRSETIPFTRNAIQRPAYEALQHGLPTTNVSLRAISNRNGIALPLLPGDDGCTQLCSLRLFY